MHLCQYTAKCCFIFNDQHLSPLLPVTHAIFVRVWEITIIISACTGLYGPKKNVTHIEPHFVNVNITAFTEHCILNVDSSESYFLFLNYICSAYLTKYLNTTFCMKKNNTCVNVLICNRGNSSIRFKLD